MTWIQGSMLDASALPSNAHWVVLSNLQFKHLTFHVLYAELAPATAATPAHFAVENQDRYATIGKYDQKILVEDTSDAFKFVASGDWLVIPLQRPLRIPTDQTFGPDFPGRQRSCAHIANDAKQTITLESLDILTDGLSVGFHCLSTTVHGRARSQPQAIIRRPLIKSSYTWLDNLQSLGLALVGLPRARRSPTDKNPFPMTADYSTSKRSPALSRAPISRRSWLRYRRCMQLRKIPELSWTSASVPAKTTTQSIKTFVVAARLTAPATGPSEHPSRRFYAPSLLAAMTTLPTIEFTLPSVQKCMSDSLIVVAIGAFAARPDPAPLQRDANHYH
jgi:hypothetical protein